MKRGLMEILVCPVCKGTLTLRVVQEDEQEVVTGMLSCARCSAEYPIEDTIPNMLPPSMR